jgi:type II secretory pathway component PulJ
LKNRKGLTLIELVVYISLFAIIILLFSRQFKAITNNYVNGKQVAKQQADSKDVVAIMVRELKNTGLKVYLDSIKPDSFARATIAGVTVSATDLSSFVHKQGNVSDTLTIFKGRLTTRGDWDGFVDTVRYYMLGTSLNRVYRTTGSAACSSSLSDNAAALQFEYGIYATNTNTPVFDQTPLVTPATKCTLSNTTGTAPTKKDGVNDTLVFSGAAKGYLKFAGSFSVTANARYKVLLRTIPLAGFPDNLDTFRFAFKQNNNTTVVGSEIFLPRTSDIHLNVGANASATVYGFIDYKTKGAGTLVFTGAEATPVTLGSLTWSWDPAAADKVNVRAIRIYLLTRSDLKSGTKETAPITVGDRSISRSGEYSWRISVQTVEIQNNGS